MSQDPHLPCQLVDDPLSTVTGNWSDQLGSELSMSGNEVLDFLFTVFGNDLQDSLPLSTTANSAPGGSLSAGHPESAFPSTPSITPTSSYPSSAIETPLSSQASPSSAMVSTSSSSISQKSSPIQHLFSGLRVAEIGDDAVTAMRILGYVKTGKMSRTVTVSVHSPRVPPTRPSSSLPELCLCLRIFSRSLAVLQPHDPYITRHLRMLCHVISHSAAMRTSFRSPKSTTVSIGAHNAYQHKVKATRGPRSRCSNRLAGCSGSCRSSGVSERRMADMRMGWASAWNAG